jgi:hypothetical protein
MLQHLGQFARRVPLHARLVQLIRWYVVTYKLPRSTAIEETKDVLEHLVEGDLSETIDDSDEQS